MNICKTCSNCFYGSFIISQMEEKNQSGDRFYCTRHGFERKAGDCCSNHSFNRAYQKMMKKLQNTNDIK